MMNDEIEEVVVTREGERENHSLNTQEEYWDREGRDVCIE